MSCLSRLSGVMILSLKIEKTNARYTTKTSVGTSVFSRLLLKSRELQSALCGFSFSRKGIDRGLFREWAKQSIMGRIEIWEGGLLIFFSQK